jgi:hypothetical protein
LWAHIWLETAVRKYSQFRQSSKHCLSTTIQLEALCNNTAASAHACGLQTLNIVRHNIYLHYKYAVAQSVEALCYKSEGRGFDSR